MIISYCIIYGHFRMPRYVKNSCKANYGVFYRALYAYIDSEIYFPLRNGPSNMLICKYVRRLVGC
jgi:hypothetical protein